MFYLHRTLQTMSFNTVIPAWQGDSSRSNDNESDLRVENGSPYELSRSRWGFTLL
jgi:hypothetical protein